MTSQLKTGILFIVLSAIILFMGSAMGGKTGLFIAGIIALVMNVGSYWFSDKIVLSAYKAKEVSATDAPLLHRIVTELAQNAGIPMPRIYVVPSPSPNAFATGRNPENAVVAVTEGILKILSADELRGVLAHEIGHILHRDILIQTVAGVMATVIMYLAQMFQWMAIFGGSSRDGENNRGGALAAIAIAIIAPIAATLVQMAISRSREFLADEAGARISGKPLSLASALAKLDTMSKQVPMQEGSPATESMFIVNPFHGGNLKNLFSTHPSTEERIRRLQAMS